MGNHLLTFELVLRSLGKDRLLAFEETKVLIPKKHCHYLDTDFLAIFIDISGHNHHKISLTLTLKYIFLALLECYMKVGAKIALIEYFFFYFFQGCMSFVGYEEDELASGHQLPH